MTYFLLTTEIPIGNGWAKTTLTINCKENMFGKKEITKVILESIKKNNPELEVKGTPNILFVMEITKKQVDYYENH